jgi:pyruvate/2-oxoglutarate dehydrogenase complex dihydrolipoamide acyltransferase (E2) component
MKRARSVTVVFAALLPVVLLTFGNGCSGCKKDEDDKPAASASAPPPAPTPVTPATVAVEEPDAGSDAGDAGVDAAKPVGPGGGGSGSLAKCCAALQQNVNSAPLDQKPYYMMAASQCNGMKNTSSGQQAFAQLRAYLQGAKMPGACK